MEGTENPLGDSNLTVEQEMQLAEMARTAAPFMNFLNQTLSARYYRQWCQSQPDHRNEREELHDKQTVLTEMVSITNKLIQRGERLYEEMKHHNSPEAKEQQRLDEQGFGLKFDQQRSVS